MELMTAMHPLALSLPFGKSLIRINVVRLVQQEVDDSFFNVVFNAAMSSAGVPQNSFLGQSYIYICILMLPCILRV